ncbi:NfeD family protein [Frondihabitans cladoniiphilus]|uniref:NfeD-like C-terminal domain-containing protein n=1 Tax=Frondihabitans cladoniiphilus TaxID=715785 RepID=A0ABP8W7R5_9MICO
MEDLLTYSWVLWLALILVFVIVEVATVEFTFLMLALGSVAGLLTAAFGGPFWLQVLVAALVSVLLLFAVRPRMLRALKRGGDPTLSNIEALLGTRAEVILPIVDGAGPRNLGQVKLANGETWTARLLAPEGAGVIESGTTVVVTAIEGSTAVVVPAERNVS